MLTHGDPKPDAARVGNRGFGAAEGPYGDATPKSITPGDIAEVGRRPPRNDLASRCLTDPAGQRSVAARRYSYGTAVSAHVQPALPLPDAQSWLSRPRLDVYLTHAGNDLGVALELYLWNSRLAAAAMGDACHLEVALRNAYDVHLARAFPDWASDPTSVLFRRTQGVQQAVAKQTALNNGSLRAIADASRGLSANPTHGQVVAALSFGFWTKLTEKDRTPTFWTPMLRHAFAAGITRAGVHDLVVKINRFRNRLAHNEPVFSTRTGLQNRLADVDALFSLINPAAAQFVRHSSTVPMMIARCPVPGLV